MDDQLNNKLKSRIIEVFDGYEAPAEEANNGWSELRKRFPAERKRRAAAWWWSSAAALLMLVLFTLWFFKKPNKDESNQLVKSSHRHTNQPINNSDSNSLPFSQREETQLPIKKPLINFSSGNTIASVIAHPNTSTTSVPSTRSYGSGDTINRTSTFIAAQAQQPHSTINSIDTAGYITEQPALATQVAQTVTDSSSKLQHAATMAELLAKDAQTHYQPEQSKPANKRLIFSVFAGTYLNYAKGSSNQLNAGAGVTSDIKLLKKLKLVTGIAIAQNSLKYDSQPLQPNVYAAAIAASGRGNNNASSIRLFAMPSATTFSSTVVSTLVSSYNASFTGLDIPLNIKYELNPDKSDSYISAGISSGTFINETYHYNYTNTLLSTTNTSAETKTQFGSFDFARTLNLSFGVGTPLGKSNRLIIEPFLKYPLSGLGSQQIRFGASGINLKLKFQTHK